MLTKNRKNFALGGLILGTALFSTGCTLDQALTIAKIISWFV